VEQLGYAVTYTFNVCEYMTNIFDKEKWLEEEINELRDLKLGVLISANYGFNKSMAEAEHLLKLINYKSIAYYSLSLISSKDFLESISPLLHQIDNFS